MGKFIVIGASKGIGKQIASNLLKENHQVINFSRTACSLSGIKNYTWDAESDSFEIFQEIQGPIDGLVYCPGTISLKPFNRFTSKDFESATASVEATVSALVLSMFPLPS